MKPTNKDVILITGAANGIGKSTALSYAKQGVQLVLLDKDTEGLDKLFEKLLDYDCPTPFMLQHDLRTTTPEVCLDLNKEITHHFGKLNVLIHNAAILGTLTAIEHFPVHDWQEIFQVNLHSVFFLTQAFIPLLKKSNPAKIIFMCDKQTHSPKPYLGAYGITKQAVYYLSQMLNSELQYTDIQVTPYFPTQIETELSKEKNALLNNNQAHTEQEIVKQPVDFFF